MVRPFQWNWGRGRFFGVMDEDTILRVTLDTDGITIRPLRSESTDPPLREFSQADIDRFLREDRLDRATAAKVRQLFGKKHVA